MSSLAELRKVCIAAKLNLDSLEHGCFCYRRGHIEVIITGGHWGANIYNRTRGADECRAYEGTDAATLRTMLQSQ